MYRLATQYHPEDLQTLWKSQNRVSRRIREALAAGSVSDSVLNGVRVLGTRIGAASLRTANIRGYFSSVHIESLGGLELEGLSEFVDDHFLVLTRLVTTRGGLVTVQLPGVAEKISRADMIRAISRSERPAVSLTQPEATKFLL
jgi:hypothetical protein